MSDKKRRDITLGEMQDECSFRGHNCETIGGEPCKHYAICNQIRTKSCTPPEDWDLSDPPRFNEAQMAFWRGWYAMGAKFVRRWKVGHITFLNEYGDTIGTIERHLDLADVLEVGETLDLAELLGKDGADADN